MQNTDINLITHIQVVWGTELLLCILFYFLHLDMALFTPSMLYESHKYAEKN